MTFRDAIQRRDFNEAPEPIDPTVCDHDWSMQDDSFDHEFGCEVIRYWLCEKCGATKPTCSADFGNPEP